MNNPKLRLKNVDGTIYDNWEEICFGDILEQYSIKTKTNNEDVLLSCAIEGMFLNSELFSHQRASDNTGYLKIDKGTLVLSAQNLHLGNANVNLRFDHGIISPAYKTFHLKGCIPEYMVQWVKRDRTKKFFFDATTTGASQCRRNVEWETLYEQQMMLPSLPEQKAIADFLSLYDRKTEIQIQVIEALEKRKRGFLQQIFSQEIRFKDESGNDFEDWETDELNSFLFENKERNKGNKFGKKDVLSVSKDYGVVNQIEYQGKSLAGNDLSNYHVVHSGNIVYTKSPLGKQPYGIIRASTMDGIVSTLYAVYYCKENILPELLDYYFSLDSTLNKYLKPLVNIGAKHDMKVSNEDAISGLVTLPTSMKEQQKIVDFFKTIDKQIQVEKDKLEAIKNVKKGLLQQMFV
ncbi:MAG: restriction endonuclease subunit S [Ruminococcaceae bacterium]|nr:restriction endonuclease subunit S [Oscillospiraceae bacterium]